VLYRIAVDHLRTSPHDLFGFALYVQLPVGQQNQADKALHDLFFQEVKDVPQKLIWRSPNPNQIICDVWRFSEERVEGRKDKHPPMQLRRMFVADKWPPFPYPKNAVLSNLELHQSFEWVLQGKFPCTAAEATNLSALYLQILNGDYSQNKNLVNELSVSRYISSDVQSVSGLSGPQAVQVLNIAYSNLEGLTIDKAQNKYFKTLRDWKLYGSTLFSVKQNKKPNIGWLAVNQKGVDLLSYPSLSPVKSWPIASIATWSADAESFNFASGTLFKPSREHFISAEAGEICSVLRAYVDYLVNPVKPNQRSPTISGSKLNLYKNTPGSKLNLSVQSPQSRRDDGSRKSVIGVQKLASPVVEINKGPTTPIGAALSALAHTRKSVIGAQKLTTSYDATTNETSIAIPPKSTTISRPTTTSSNDPTPKTGWRKSIKVTEGSEAPSNEAVTISSTRPRSAAFKSAPNLFADSVIGSKPQLSKPPF